MSRGRPTECKRVLLPKQTGATNAVNAFGFLLESHFQKDGFRVPVLFTYIKKCAQGKQCFFTRFEFKSFQTYFYTDGEKLPYSIRPILDIGFSEVQNDWNIVPDCQHCQHLFLKVIQADVQIVGFLDVHIQTALTYRLNAFIFYIFYLFLPPESRELMFDNILQFIIHRE